MFSHVWCFDADNQNNNAIAYIYVVWNENVEEC